MYREGGKRTLGRVGALIVPSTTSEHSLQRCLLPNLFKIDARDSAMDLLHNRWGLSQTDWMNSSIRATLHSAQEVQRLQYTIGGLNNCCPATITFTQTTST